MSHVQNVIVENATGDAVGLVCCEDGQDPWTHFPSLSQSLHSVRTDAPVPCYCRDSFQSESKHNWNGSTWDEISSSEDLSIQKDIKIKSIDTRTGQLIGAGYTYASKQFSLSANAQRWLAGLKAGLDLLQPSDYPLRINTIDDSDNYDIADENDAKALFGTALATVKSRLASGTALKDSVRAATTVAEVAAVEDTR
jgi:hypothetical protein